jgi:tRNA (guanine37-N1)-methyltransferase
MQFEIITIFPEFFAGPLDYGIVRRAREARLVDVRVHDLRAFAHDRHRTVDDRPFGGGEGMVLKPEPLFEAVESLAGDAGARRDAPLKGEATPAAPSATAIVLLSASGKLFRQETARRFALLDRIILLCGRYEGVDERVAEHLATDELSIGDFVLSGGALGNEDSTVNESFSAPENLGGAASPITGHESRVANHVLLDFPHYTRPAEFRGWNVPEILLGGNHEEIRRWRQQKALEKTRRNRPDLLGNT